MSFLTLALGLHASELTTATALAFRKAYLLALDDPRIWHVDSSSMPQSKLHKNFVVEIRASKIRHTGGSCVKRVDRAPCQQRVRFRRQISMPLLFGPARDCVALLGSRSSGRAGIRGLWGPEAPEARIVLLADPRRRGETPITASPRGASVFQQVYA